MTNIFNTKRLANHRVLVTGSTDEQSQVLSSAQWDSIKEHQSKHDLADAHDRALSDFLAPLNAALDAANKAAANISRPDPNEFIVLHEGTDGVEAVREDVVHLDYDSQVLRLIENGETDRLIWVNSRIEILEFEGGAEDEESEDSLAEVWASVQNAVESID